MESPNVFSASAVVAPGHHLQDVTVISHLLDTAECLLNDRQQFPFIFDSLYNVQLKFNDSPLHFGEMCQSL